ncbi:MAG: hypothetical protein Q9218_003354 [Villophora microphyllina]
MMIYNFHFNQQKPGCDQDHDCVIDPRCKPEKLGDRYCWAATAFRRNPHLENLLAVSPAVFREAIPLYLRFMQEDFQSVRTLGSRLNKIGPKGRAGIKKINLVFERWHFNGYDNRNHKDMATKAFKLLGQCPNLTELTLTINVFDLCGPGMPGIKALLKIRGIKNLDFYFYLQGRCSRPWSCEEIELAQDRFLERIQIIKNDYPPEELEKRAAKGICGGMGNNAISK